MSFLASLLARAWIVPIVALCACSNIPVTVKRVDAGTAFEKAYRSAITHHELSWHSQTRLYGHGLEEGSEATAIQLLADIGPKLEASSDWQDDFTLAEILFLAARASEEEEASRYYVDAIVHAALALFAKDGPDRFDPRMQVLLGLYDVALGEVLTLYHERHGHPQAWTQLEGREKTWPVRFESRWDVGHFDRFVVSDTLEFHGTGPRHRAFGIGAPLVALRSNGLGDRDKDHFYPSHGLAVPVTLLLHGDPRNPDGVVVRLEDPLKYEHVEISGMKLPIAADFSAAVACLVAGRDTSQYDNAGFFHPGHAVMPQGIRLLQPYDPAKIPVVLTHGLWSDPVIWRYLSNAILGDPVLRREYQVWIYLYSTGMPLLSNSAAFRRELDDVRTHFDPEYDDPAMQDIVLVGHSMGGLLSSSAVRRSDHEISDIMFKVPAAEYEPRIRDDELAQTLIKLEPKTYVHRVIFMSTPHGGSSMSETFIGRLGMALISPHEKLEQALVEFQEAYGDILADDIDHVATSVEMLSPNNAVLQAIRRLPMGDGVKFHSVIGQIEPGPAEEGSDGVVPYTSSHLDGAESELIIRSDHSTELRAAGIAEVCRILRLHLDERSR